MHKPSCFAWKTCARVPCLSFLLFHFASPPPSLMWISNFFGLFFSPGKQQTDYFFNLKKTDALSLKVKLCSIAPFLLSFQFLPPISVSLCLPLLSAFLQPLSFSLSPPSRFQGNDQCVCGEVSVTEQYNQLQWDAFTVDVLDSLYNTSPISMHCNRSNGDFFPVSPQSYSCDIQLTSPKWNWVRH